LRQYNDKLKEKKHEINNNNTKFEEAKVELINEINDLRNLNESNLNENDLLKQKIEILENNLNNVDKKLRSSLNDNEVHISQIKLIKLKLDEFEGKNKEMHNELNKYYYENKYYKDELNIKIKDIETYLAKIDELKAEYSNKIDEHQKVRIFTFILNSKF